MAVYEPVEKKKLSNVQLTVLFGVLILAASMLFILFLGFLSVHGRNSSLNLDRVSEDMQAMKFFFCDYKDNVEEHLRSLADRKCRSELLNGNGMKAEEPADNEIVNGVVIKKRVSEEEERESLRLLRKEDKEMIEDKKPHYFCKYSNDVLARIFETMNTVCSGDAKLSRFSRSYNAE